MRKILLFLSLIISTITFAQLPKSLMEQTKRVSTFDDYSGTIYLKDKHKESSVIDEKSGTFDAKLRYNVYTDALEYKSGSELYNIVKVPTIHARLDGDYFYYCQFMSERGINLHGYYALVELNDKYRIYKRYRTKIVEPIEASLTQVAIDGKVKIMTTYYLEEDGVVIELPRNKKEILATFSDKKTELGDYIKKEKIRFRKEEDLIRFIAKYNALKSIESDPSKSLLSNRGGGM